jgi:hypothetical protein
VDTVVHTMKRTGVDGEAVWSWRRDAGVKFAKSFAYDGDNKARSSGRHGISR